MPVLINLADIPSEGLPIECGIPSSEITLSSDDGEILGSLNCTGQVFVSEDHLVNFQGMLTGTVIRECIRCLMSFEENLSLSCDAEFRRPYQSSTVLLPSKKMKQSSRKHQVAINDEHENEIDAYPITDNQIDLLPAVREHLILTAPLQPLCHEGCAGLCQVCGANLNEGDCGCCLPVMASSSLLSYPQNPYE